MANLLQFETSPYLLQHAHNPVAWRPWSDEAFSIAAAEQKPVLVSIGYATCHWCHVMERESFENEAVAAYMNEHFICVKVDREEHPDVDHMYMDALIAMQQSGGWPLNMFVTPDRKPFYGGTYFPPERYYNRNSWMEVLEAIHYTWTNKQEDIQLQANQLIQHLGQVNAQAKIKPQNIALQDLDTIKDRMLKMMDAQHGGFSAAPKFLATSCIQFLLDYAYFNENKEVFTLANLNLEKMLRGGIYDQIGGGISRYSTDNEWLVPHFEKMLYDNALIVRTLSSSCKIKHNPYFLEKIHQTIQWANEWLYEPKTGLFYSAVDADSEGVEGKYYVWQYEELKQLIPANYWRYFERYLGLLTDGNWEGNIILSEVYTDEEIVANFELDATFWKAIKQEVFEILLNYRSQRIPPIVDTKLIISQNAMWATALLAAYKATGQESYLIQAQQCIDSILSACNEDPELLLHIYNKTTIKANLEDYAWLVAALVDLYEITQESRYAIIAKEFVDYTIKHFDSESLTFFSFSHENQQDILVKKVELYDGAIPSSNSIMLHNLLRIGNLYSDFSYLERAHYMMFGVWDQVLHYVTSYAQFATYIQLYKNEINVIKTNDELRKIHINYYAPHVIFTKSEEIINETGEIFYQNCVEGRCEMPTNKGFELFQRKKITSYLF